MSTTSRSSSMPRASHDRRTSRARTCWPPPGSMPCWPPSRAMPSPRTARSASSPWHREGRRSLVDFRSMSPVVSATAAENREVAITAATSAVQSGQLVVIPTDTVYGIGCDAFDADAVHRLLAAKGRGRDVPPPVLIGEMRTLDGIATDIEPYVRDLVERFWPGALTVVVRAQPSLGGGRASRGRPGPRQSTGRRMRRQPGASGYDSAVSAPESFRRAPGRPCSTGPRASCRSALRTRSTERSP